MLLTPAHPLDVAPQASHLRRVGAVVLLLALAGAAAALRAGPLAPSSLWLDDAAPALSHRAESLHLVLVTGMAAPGFAALLRLVFEVVGFSELAAQALPFAFGVLGPPLTWLVARSAGLRTGAVVAAVVLLVAPEHVVYASRVKPYTLDAALCLLLLGVASAILRAPHRRRPWAVLAVAASVAVFLSAAVAPTVAAAFAAGWWAAWRGRVVGREALLASVTTGVSALGVYLLLVRPAATDALESMWSPHFLPTDASWPAAALDAVRRLADGILPVPADWGVAALGAAAIVVLARRHGAETVLLLGPLVLTAALATAGLMPLGGGRTDVHLYASLALLLGVALDRVPVVAAPAGLALLASVTAPPPYPSYDVRPLVQQLEREKVGDDGVLVYSATRWAYGVYTSGPVRVEQTGRQANNFEPVPLDPDVHVLGAHRHDPEGHRPEVSAFTCDRTRVWLLASHTTPDVDVAQAALGELGFAVSIQSERPGAALQLWERDGPGC